MRRILFNIMVLAGLINGGSFLAADPLDTAWRNLDDTVPSPIAVQVVTSKGADWKIVRSSDGFGPKSRDYYSIRVSKLPEGVENSSDLLDAYLAHLVSQDRASNHGLYGVSFIEDDSTRPIAVGKLFRLNFTPIDFISCANLPQCNGAWWQPQIICAALDQAYKNWCPLGMQKGWIVISARTPLEVRVTTVFAGADATSDGRHPVAGTRAFGVSKSGDEWVVYTMAADKSGFPEAPDWAVQYFGFAMADQFWSRFNDEFAKFIVSKGGVASARKGIQKIEPAPPSGSLP